MVRERTLAALGSLALIGAVFAPGVVAPQPMARVYRVVYLGVTPITPATQPNWDALVDGLRERGYVVGRNLVLESRWSPEMPRPASSRSRVGSPSSTGGSSSTSRSSTASPQFTRTAGLPPTVASWPSLVPQGRTLCRPYPQGTPPGDLPVELPTTFDLLLNLRGARAIGLSLPRPMPLRADSIIE